MSEFGEPVEDTIEDHDWVCPNHGVIPTDLIAVSVGGQLICEMCSAAQIGDPNKDIDKSLEMLKVSDYDPKWHYVDEEDSPNAEFEADGSVVED